MIFTYSNIKRKIISYEFSSNLCHKFIRGNITIDSCWRIKFNEMKIENFSFIKNLKNTFLILKLLFVLIVKMK